MPHLPNVWPYNTERFAQSEIGVQLMMANKLVVKAKRSLFFVIANGPHQGEDICLWEVRVNNVRNKVAQHKEAHGILQNGMYQNASSMNGTV